jgi:hypothetical protein
MKGVRMGKRERKKGKEYEEQRARGFSKLTTR